MLLLNAAGTHYTKKGFPNMPSGQGARRMLPKQQVGQPYAGKDEATNTASVYVREEGQYPGVPPGWYLVDDEGRLAYRIDVPIKRGSEEHGQRRGGARTVHGAAAAAVRAHHRGHPRRQAGMGPGHHRRADRRGDGADGRLGALPVAVGMYLRLGTATPIFVGGLLRWLTDRSRGVSASEAETETSPGVLLSSGYIAGGTLCGLLIGFLVMCLSRAVMNKR